MGKLIALVLAAVMAGACGSPPTAKSSPAASPAPSAAPSPAPASDAVGVLVGTPNSKFYTVSLVGTDGKVVASAEANYPTYPICSGGQEAVVPPPVSTSDTRVYFMDGSEVVYFLARNGDKGRATTFPVSGPMQRRMFAVSPDDQRIAVVVADYGSGGATTRLYVEDLNGGGNHVELFSESGGFSIWPIGWHGGSLVVGKVPACSQGQGFGCCGPQEYHVVDPATAARRFQIGGPQCLIAGPPSPAGVGCENQTHLPDYCGPDGCQAEILDWTGNTTSSWPIKFATFVALSPNGKIIAVVSDSTTSLTARFEAKTTTLSLAACGWIDDNHVLAGSTAQKQAHVADITNRVIVEVAAHGDCAGRIPGGL